METSIRSDIHLEDAGGTDCLPTTTIFEELARMGYEKPSQRLTFYKAFFSPQWKFLIHTITQCLSAKTTAWNEFSSTMASAIICLATNQNFNLSNASKPGEEGLCYIDQRMLEFSLVDVTQGEINLSCYYCLATTTTTTRDPGLEWVVVKCQVNSEQKTSSPQGITTFSKTKDKGKRIMIETEVPLKKKDQVALDEEIVRNLEAQLQAELIEEERLARKKERRSQHSFD
ncbi:hypothetical protein Tco_1409593 [Tanacetum coccineum]